MEAVAAPKRMRALKYSMGTPLLKTEGGGYSNVSIQNIKIMFFPLNFYSILRENAVIFFFLLRIYARLHVYT